VGPDILIDAIPCLFSAKQDAVVVLVGEGHMRGELEGRVQQMGIGHAVRFVGSKTGQELRDFYKAADCVVVPSRNEPFGIVVCS
jgi:glycosyltransferase involved in cell wall biosynthesis